MLLLLHFTFLDADDVVIDGVRNAIYSDNNQ